MARPAQDILDSLRGRPGWAGGAVAERGKHTMRIAHPTIPGRFAVDCIAAPLHYGSGPYSAANEIDTDWQPTSLPQYQPYQFVMDKADYVALFSPGNQGFSTAGVIRFAHPASGETVSFTPQQLQWINQLGQIQPIATQTSAAPSTFGADYIEWATAYGPGLAFRWINDPSRLAKHLTINSLASLPAPTIGGVVGLNLQFIFTVSNGVDVIIDGQVWNKRTEARTTGPALFKLAATGETLWAFTRPFAADALDNTVACETVYKKTGNSLIVQVRVPWSWLQTATYPVIIDPTVDLQMTAGIADASELADQSLFELTGSVLEANANSNQAIASNLGSGWTTSGITNGDTVDVCYVEMYVPNTALDDIRAVGYFNDVDSAVDFNTDNDIELRTKTTASATYDATAIGVGWYGSGVSLVSPFQEVVDRAGFAAGNGLVFLLLGDTSGSYTRSFRCRASEFTGNLHGLKLHYEYTVASADVLNRGMSGIEFGVVASGGGGYSGLHPIEAGYV